MSEVRAMQCVQSGGEKVPHTRHWPGHHFRHPHEEGDQTSSKAAVGSEHMYRSRETVRAWLESSPTSVLEDLDDESGGPSSFDSSPTGSIEHLSYTTRFPMHASRSTNPNPGHTRSRTISPPRSANRNSVDLSRIDPAHYTSGGSFLVLAFKNAQHRGVSAPPVFQHASTDEHVEPLRIEECGSEFSLTSEWQNMLAAGTKSTGSNSAFETPGEELALNISDLDCDAFEPKPPPKLTHRRSRSMELSGAAVMDDDKSERETDAAGTRLDHGPTRRLSRRDSLSFNCKRETPGETEKRKLISRYEREEKEIKSWEDHRREKAASTLKHPELSKVKVKNDIITAHRKAEEKNAKRGEKAARGATTPTPTESEKGFKRISKFPRGCLFLFDKE